MIDLLEVAIRKVDKTPAERLAELSPKSKLPQQHAKVNDMLDTLDLKVD